MKHNIEPVINPYFSCHQGLLSTYASYQKRDYDMIFAESWGFHYEKGDCPFGKSLHPGYQKRRKLLLDKFHGIKIKDEQYAGKENLLELFTMILPYSPVIIFQDVYDCPWNMSYKRNHINHYILVTGIEESTKALYALDPYSTKDENIINVDCITRESGAIYSFVTTPLNNLKVEDYLEEITTSLNHIKNSNFFHNIECFKNDFQTRFEEVMLSEYTDVYAIPLIININRIVNQRYCYCLFLNKMISKKLLDPSILNMVESIAEKYGLFRILLIKQIMKKKRNNECLDIISEIIRNEYEVYEKMKSFQITGDGTNDRNTTG
ncbi:MAG: hypothetical protein LBQ15_12730 [Clostridium sp.]|jgi:hypothetical protein|nr:hypothetical protein [Clostridium sp.]